MVLRNPAAGFAFAVIVGSFCIALNAATDDPSSPVAAAAISLDEAIRRAEASDPAYANAMAESAAMRLEKANAKTALLPTLLYHNQVIYTQPNGQTSRIGQTVGEPTPVFIANNAIREYASQGVLTETVGLQQVASLHLAIALAARAAAEAEIARRGLVATVVDLYYSYWALSEKATISQRALDEANNFLETTRQRESAREAAHSDVVKAEIQQQQRSRDVADAQLADDKAKLELAVLLFADPETPYRIEDPTPPFLPDRSATEIAAQKNNPELRSAFAVLESSRAESASARAALFPELGVNVTYGIDAPQFAVNGPAAVRNLGYSGSVSLDIPIWDWLSSERKLKASHIRERAAESALTAAQRRLLANLREFYAEAEISQHQLSSLDQSVMSAQESLRLTNLRYRNAEGTVLEVVDAESTLTSAELARADGMTRYQKAISQLQTLTGRL